MISPGRAAHWERSAHGRRARFTGPLKKRRVILLHILNHFFKCASYAIEKRKRPGRIRAFSFFNIQFSKREHLVELLRRECVPAAPSLLLIRLIKNRLDDRLLVSFGKVRTTNMVIIAVLPLALRE